MSNFVKISTNDNDEMFEISVGDNILVSGNYWDFRFPEDLCSILAQCGVQCTLEKLVSDDEEEEEE